jgi:RIP homotypic interaction motif
MDPISVIVAALAAGAGAGVKDTASRVVKDAYAGLYGLVKRRFSGRPVGETILVQHEKAPEVWQAPLSAELEAVNAAADPRIVAAAQQLLALVDEAGARSGKYRVNMREAQGVQVGDYNTQTNTF